jgi:down syndrome cell adhesion molecule homolog
LTLFVFTFCYLLLDEAPNFHETFSNQVLNPGGPLSLICSARGNPLPQITWQLDGHNFQGTHRSRFADFVSRQDKVVSFLNISDLRVEDGGVYKCIAENSAGKIYHQQRIDVLGAPSLKPMSNLTVLEGDTVLVSCPVYGYPFGNIIWYKGRQNCF